MQLLTNREAQAKVAPAWVVAAPAGSSIGFLAAEQGAGAALFAWSQADPYEQLSDAYTFMERRKIYPGAGDHLYSTLRRPILTVTLDEPGQCIDMLRHDHWHPRSVCAEVLGSKAQAKSLWSPRLREWPYALNIFARTMVSTSGELSDAALSVPEGSYVELTARSDVIVAVLAASRGKIVLHLDDQPV